MLDFRENELSADIDHLMAKTFWAGRLTRALASLRARYPEARLEIAGIELALNEAIRGVEDYLRQREAQSLGLNSSCSGADEVTETSRLG